NTATGSATALFAPKVDITSGSTPIGIVVRDLNADGKDDIAVSNRGAAAIAVFLNLTSPGASVISLAPKVDITTATQPYCDAAADINSDGKMDLVSVNGSANSVSAFLNTMTLGNALPTAAPKTDFTSAGINSTAVAGNLAVKGARFQVRSSMQLSGIKAVWPIIRVVC
ncbi:MAG: VCBS repeat-containing protein, partial [Cytophagaceae bacterium]